VVDETVGREAVAEAADQGVGEAALGGADGAGIPLVGFKIIDGDESGFAAHGQADVFSLQDRIYLLA
jgi:hypothetical protein